MALTRRFAARTAAGRAASTVLALAVQVAFAAGEPASGDAHQQARQLVQQGKYADAEARARALLAEMDTRGEEESAMYAEALDVLVESLWRGGKAQEDGTRQAAERVLALKERLYGPGNPQAAESLNNLAAIEFFVGRYGDARAHWESALALRVEALGPKHPDAAQVMNNLGNLLLTTGDLESARPFYEQALAARREAFGEEHPLVAQSLNNLAVLQEEAGDYAQALPLAEQALALYEKLLPPGHPKVATSLTALARVLLQTGDSARALALLEKGEQIWEKALGPGHPTYAVALNNRADQLRLLGRLDEARPLYERALAILEKAYGPAHPELAGCLSGLGALEEAAGNIPEAVALQRRVVTIKEKVLGPDHPRLALSLNDLGGLLRVSGDLPEAASLLERAVAIRRKALGPDHPDVAASLIRLAAVRLDEGRSGEALAEALESERIARDHLRLTGRTLAERHALRYASIRESGLDLILTMAASGRLGGEERRAALDAVVRSRAVVLDGIAARQRSAALSRDPAVARLSGALGTARARLATLTVKGLGEMDPARYRELLEEARQEKERAERALASASAEFVADRERGMLGLGEVARNLPRDTALVAFALYRDAGIRTPAGASYIAFVLPAGETDPGAVALGPAGALENVVAEWKKEASGGSLGLGAEASEEIYRSVGGELRQRLWDPVARHLGRAGRVFVVPDGEISLVSFASLPAGRRGYLVERGPVIHYLSAERDLVRVGGDAPRGSGLLVVAAPDYDDSGTGPVPPAGAAPGGAGPRPQRRPACGFDSLRFSPLRGAEQEGDQISTIWRSAADGSSPDAENLLLLGGAGAAEATFKGSAPGRRLLHMATHGFFLASECAGADALESPLLHSGLALAGANRRGSTDRAEDGILTAEEIASLDLSGVDLAVLSACDTGVGAIHAGEGVIGLRRAMQVAGVRTLVMSLWPVEDEATRRWMAAMYEEVLKHDRDAAEAVRNAGLASLAARRSRDAGTHPFYWAAFVAAGSPR